MADLDFPGNRHTITIPLDEYRNLLQSDLILTALYNAGVDNWDGYEEVIAWLDREDEEQR